jgi:hypothetical protein
MLRYFVRIKLNMLRLNPVYAGFVGREKSDRCFLRKLNR